jgi:hypothetical protein
MAPVRRQLNHPEKFTGVRCPIVGWAIQGGLGASVHFESPVRVQHMLHGRANVDAQFSGVVESSYPCSSSRSAAILSRRLFSVTGVMTNPALPILLTALP